MLKDLGTKRLLLLLGRLQLSSALALLLGEAWVLLSSLTGRYYSSFTRYQMISFAKLRPSYNRITSHKLSSNREQRCKLHQFANAKCRLQHFVMIAISWNLRFCFSLSHYLLYLSIWPVFKQYGHNPTLGNQLLLMVFACYIKKKH